MTIKQALVWSNKTLHKIDPQFIEGSILLSFCLGKNKEYLYTHPEQRLTEAQLKNYKKLITRRLKKEPIAYLIKQKEFYGLKFYVDKNVLIPRPETELIIDEILKINQNQKLKTILDIGTGSGCIAISLAKHLPKVKIFATDISQKALLVAKKNAKQHNVLKKIKFLQGDLIKPLKNQRFDLIIANLPYLIINELKNVPFEPKKALFGGKNGLEIIEKFLAQVKNILKPNSIIYLEISPTPVDKIKKLAKKYLPEKKMKFIKDLSLKNRIVVIK